MNYTRCAAAAVALLVSSAAIANEVKFGTSLAPVAAGARGTGWASVDIDLSLRTMLVRTGFSGLSGNSTAAHIHGPTASFNTGTAGVMTETPSFTGFPLGVKSGVYEHLFDMTQASSYNPSFLNDATNQGSISTAFNTLVNALADDKAYLNIHTSTFQSGEIRGFFKIVTPTPEPSSLAALVGAMLILRRRRLLRHE